MCSVYDDVIFRHSIVAMLQHKRLVAHCDADAAAASATMLLSVMLAKLRSAGTFVMCTKTIDDICLLCIHTLCQPN